MNFFFLSNGKHKIKLRDRSFSHKLRQTALKLPPLNKNNNKKMFRATNFFSAKAFDTAALEALVKLENAATLKSIDDPVSIGVMSRLKVLLLNSAKNPDNNISPFLSTQQQHQQQATTTRDKHEMTTSAITEGAHQGGGRKVINSIAQKSPNKRSSCFWRWYCPSLLHRRKEGGLYKWGKSF
ncbi:unnamed protein product [Heterosigma akashiwo]